MSATFTVPADSRTILRSATGHAFTPDAGPGLGRVVLILDDADAAKVASLRGTRRLIVTVTDQMTGIAHRVSSAPCGAGCHCGAVLVR